MEYRLEAYYNKLELFERLDEMQEPPIDHSDWVSDTWGGEYEKLKDRVVDQDAEIVTLKEQNENLRGALRRVQALSIGPQTNMEERFEHIVEIAQQALEGGGE